MNYTHGVTKQHPELAYEIVLSNLERKLKRIELACRLTSYEDNKEEPAKHLADEIISIIEESNENILSKLIRGS